MMILLYIRYLCDLSKGKGTGFSYFRLFRSNSLRMLGQFHQYKVSFSRVPVMTAFQRQ